MRAVRSHAAAWALVDRLRSLEDRYRKTRSFLAARKRMHVDKFYGFLEHAGRVSSVLVVKGDHDDDFPRDYDCRRIDAIRGCREISGKIGTVGGWKFLGLGFDQAGYRRPLREIISKFKDTVGVVVAHAPQKNVQLLAKLCPRLIIRGHFGGGRFLIDGVPAVFTSSDYAMIEITKTTLPRIRCAADWWERDLRRTYSWLRPYPMPPVSGTRSALALRDLGASRRRRPARPTLI
jgi:hypothetical protein